MLRPTPQGSRRATRKNVVQMAHDLAPYVKKSTLEKSWKELYQMYEDELRKGRTHDKFPDWVLSKIPHEVIPLFLEAVYKTGATGIPHYAPCIEKKFKVPAWKCVLFFGRLPQNKIKHLRHIVAQRPKITFDRLYSELCQYRSRNEPLPKGPFDFEREEFEHCMTPNEFDDRESSSDPDGANIFDQSDENNTDIDEANILDQSDENNTDIDENNNSDNEYEPNWGIVNEDSAGTIDGAASSSSNEDDDHAHEFDDEDDPWYPSDSLNSDTLSDPGYPIGDDLNGDIDSPVRRNSPSLFSDSPIYTSSPGGSAAEAATMGGSQPGQDQELQDIESATPEPTRLLSEPMATTSIMAAGDASTDLESRSLSANKTSSQLLVDLANKLEQEKVTRQNSLALAKANYVSAHQSFLQLLDRNMDRSSLENWRMAQSKLSALEVLDKKRKVEQARYEEHQVKRGKFEEDVKELYKRVIQHNAE